MHFLLNNWIFIVLESCLITANMRHYTKIKPPIKEFAIAVLCTFVMLWTYFYVIGIFFDKTHFTYIWVNLSRFKMIITSSYIKDMKIIQELLKKSVICRSRYLLDRSSICRDSLKLDTCLDLSSLWDSSYSQQRFYSKKAICLWVCRFV